jgi:hypothetical protein
MSIKILSYLLQCSHPSLILALLLYHWQIDRDLMGCRQFWLLWLELARQFDRPDPTCASWKP